MIKKRINTDLFVKLNIVKNGQSVDLSSVNNLKVFLYECGNKVEYPFKINNTVVEIQYPKLLNTKLGIYGITVEYTKVDENSEVGSVSYAADFPTAFAIVPYSTEEENVDTKLSSTVINKI